MVVALLGMGVAQLVMGARMAVGRPKRELGLLQGTTVWARVGVVQPLLVMLMVVVWGLGRTEELKWTMAVGDERRYFFPRDWGNFSCGSGGRRGRGGGGGSVDFCRNYTNLYLHSVGDIQVAAITFYIPLWRAGCRRCGGSGGGDRRSWSWLE